jgi:hypothetical protein
MSMKVTSIFFLALFLLLPTFAFASSRGGFASGAIWLSKEIITAGDSVRISASLYNSYDDRLAGTVSFKDGSHIVGEASFSLSAGEGTIVSVTTRPDVGEHSYYAEITEATLDTDEGEVRATEVIGTKTAVIARTVRPKPEELKEQTAAAISTTERAQEKITEVSPTAGKVINPLLERIDSFRADAAEYTAEAMTSARARIAEATSTEPAYDGKVLGVETPAFLEKTVESKGARAGWGYLLLYLNAILNTILRSAALFYPIAAITLFFALRMLYRKLTGRYY